MSEWKSIDTLPADETVMLGAWFAVDRVWFWQASGCFTEGIFMFIDFLDDVHSATGFNAPTHWRELDQSPPQA